MSIDSTLGGLKTLTNQVQGGVNSLTRIGADLGLGGVGGSGSNWMDSLREASFRGVPFVMLKGDSRFGRRNVVHEYPFRDTVWVEDLGRSARRFNVQGFLVGADCIAQRERMIAACEAAGGETAALIHPTYGQLAVNLVGALTVRERWDKGRMFEIGFSFIESGEREFPSGTDASAEVVSTAADSADAAVGTDFGSSIASALKNGASVVQQAVSATATWASTATRLANDATNLRNLVTALPGDFGRFAGGRNVGGIAGSTSKLAGSSATIASLTALGSQARSAVATATSALGAAASGLGL
jgi:prophage DNA circulation protein